MIEKVLCRHEHPRSTKAALHGPVLHEGLLQRMLFLPVRGQPFHCGDIGSVAVCSKDQTGINRLPIENNDAGSALPGAASSFGAGQSKTLPQHAEESFMGLDLHHDWLSVDLE
jgi:hypothetical protein